MSREFYKNRTLKDSRCFEFQGSSQGFSLTVALLVLALQTCRAQENEPQRSTFEQASARMHDYGARKSEN